MTDADTTSVAHRLIAFLETGAAPGLFTDDAFLDFTPPLWRLQAQGADAVIDVRRRGHPGPSTVAASRIDATPTGFVLEVEERWEQDGKAWYCRELMRADVRAGQISALSVYCTGDWTPERVAQHARDVRLLRP